MQDIQEMCQCIHEKSQQFEMIREQIGEELIEVQRRMDILNEVISWSPMKVETYQAIVEALGNAKSSQGINNYTGLEDAYQTTDAEETEIAAYQKLPAENGF